MSQHGYKLNGESAQKKQKYKQMLMQLFFRVQRNFQIKHYRILKF